MTHLTTEQPKRRFRLAISLRAMIVLVLVVGLVLGWRVSKARQQKLISQAIRERGGTIYYDWEVVGGRYVPGRKPRISEWVRRFVGDEYFQEIAQVNLGYDYSTKDSIGRQHRDLMIGYLRNMSYVTHLDMYEFQVTDTDLAVLRNLPLLESLTIWNPEELSDAGIAQLRSLKRLVWLRIVNPRMTDSGIAALAKLPSLERLEFEGHGLSDSALVHLRKCKRLKHLYFHDENQITDDGLENLRGMTTLETLNIHGSRVTDKGLEVLATLPNLKLLNVPSATVTHDAVSKLQRRLPRLKIWRY